MKSIKKYGKRFIPLFVLCCLLLCSFDCDVSFASESKSKSNSFTLTMDGNDEFYRRTVVTPSGFLKGFYFNFVSDSISVNSNNENNIVYFIGSCDPNDTKPTYYEVDYINGNQVWEGSLDTTFLGPDSAGFPVYYFCMNSSASSSYSLIYDLYDVLVSVSSAVDSSMLLNVWNSTVNSDSLSDGVDSITSSSDSSFVDAVDEIGYLQNLSCKTHSVNVSSSHFIPVQQFFFSTTTTTGKKLYDAGMDVQYMLTAQSYDGKSAFDSKSVYKSAKSDLFLLSMNEHVYDDEHLNSLKTGTFWFSAASDTWQNMYSEIKDGLSAFSNMYFIREFFIRPIYRENVFSPIQYGGWSKVIIDTDGKIHVQDGYINQSDDNPDSSPDSDGILDNVTNEYEGDHSIGSGDDLDESGSNAESWDKVFDTVDDVMDSFDNFDIRSLDDIFNQLSQGVKGFANLFNIVFSWVPQWLRYSIIAAISIWVFMLIKKAIFG